MTWSMGDVAGIFVLGILFGNIIGMCIAEKLLKRKT